MRKGSVTFLTLCLTGLFLLAFLGEVAAFEALDGKLRVNGFARNETGVRLQEHVWVDDLDNVFKRYKHLFYKRAILP